MTTIASRRVSLFAVDQCRAAAGGIEAQDYESIGVLLSLCEIDRVACLHGGEHMREPIQRELDTPEVPVVPAVPIGPTPAEVLGLIPHVLGDQHAARVLIEIHGDDAPLAS